MSFAHRWLTMIHEQVKEGLSFLKNWKFEIWDELKKNNVEQKRLFTYKTSSHWTVNSNANIISKDVLKSRKNEQSKM